MSGPTLTVDELAAFFGVGTGTVRAWIHSGELKAVDVCRSPGGRKPRWRVTPAALAAFEQSRAPAPAAPRQRRRRASAGDVIQFYSPENPTGS